MRVTVVYSFYCIIFVISLRVLLVTQAFPRGFVEKIGTRAKKSSEGGGGRERRKPFPRLLFRPPPSIFHFFRGPRSNFCAMTRLETLAAQVT